MSTSQKITDDLSLKNHTEILTTKSGVLRKIVPSMDDFFTSSGLPLPHNEITPAVFFTALDHDTFYDIGMDQQKTEKMFVDFCKSMAALTQKPVFKLKSLTIIGGHNKSGEAEELNLKLRPGQIICIVGPTGSGKSRLLADIEWMARGDTPTGRHILINNKPPEISWRHSQEHRLFAQLSQNMNFVMDMNVADFIRMHAESRLVNNITAKVDQVINRGNELAGEPFTPQTLLTDLSGGQSRALMIADIAHLSRSPVVLIDEIENAGIDRKKALDLLIGEEKIVLLATHDPIFALMGDQRLVLKNGGINHIITPSAKEKDNLKKIDRIDAVLLKLRHYIRQGKAIDFEIETY